ncbi:PAS domain S-box-containing protein/diguanylate cyclase (GGDEF) domain-containing protein [Desulfonispora thiosulfatigenes DSM 11270]|uniref:PAS domain S-box-containing protein/diguanylate cyclase (GGDEF) domain-containing protein n=1 Tax=Desulfonispora thiosulfatigenes DSM 11270 TaxID=656914 RepID=A0A1W1V3J7_DESTI|nr:sensor domain-containing diguanylate cyclase [Desulfonispora thiosulfatigenes]SMB87902.1 PAS domain S-box-containing protein/diguanylate cyclase (GGDEF) domain-containing protein [Desulfonispora thiosulfatigenes DSM 11270]
MPYTFYHEILENLPIGYAYSKILYNEAGKVYDFEFLEVNSLFKKFSGLDIDKIEGKRASEVYKERTEEINWIEFCSDVALNTGSKTIEQYWNLSHSGYRIKLYVPKKDYLIAFLTDITKEIEQIRILDRFFSINLDLLCISDLAGNFIRLNKEWEWVLGYPLEEIENKNILDFIHPEDIEPTMNALEKLGNNKQVFNFINRYRRQDGTYRYIEWRSQPDGELIYAAARDITDRKKMEDTLRESEEKHKELVRVLNKSANYDQLTNLPNRRLFFERLKQEIKQSNRESIMFALMFIDLDGFKGVNDKYGHDIGDKLLIETASRISGCVRSSDTVARMGGDEFTVILRSITSKEDIKKVARNILQALHQPFYLDEYKCLIGASIGIALYPRHGEDAEILLANADEAMYIIKHKDKGSFCFYDEENCKEK